MGCEYVDPFMEKLATPLAVLFFVSIIAGIVYATFTIYIMRNLLVDVCVEDKTGITVVVTIVEENPATKVRRELSDTIRLGNVVLSDIRVYDDYIVATSEYDTYAYVYGEMFYSIKTTITVTGILYPNGTALYTISVKVGTKYDFLRFSNKSVVRLNDTWKPIPVYGRRIEYRILALKGDKWSLELAREVYGFLKKIGANVSFHEITSDQIGRKKGFLIRLMGRKYVTTINNTVVIHARNKYEALTMLPTNIKIMEHDLRQENTWIICYKGEHENWCEVRGGKLYSIVYFAYGVTTRFYEIKTSLFKINKHTIPPEINAWIETKYTG